MKTKLKNTNSNSFKKEFHRYLVECIDFEDLSDDASKEAKLSALRDEFDRVSNYPYNIEKFPNNQERFADYLAGLPIAIDYLNDKILEVAKNCHEVDELDDAQSTKIIANWWILCACHYLRMIEKI